jgi:hypothetical protein
LDASGPRNPVTELGSGPPDSSSFAAAGALWTVVEHPEASSTAAKPAAAIPVIIFFRKLLFITISFIMLAPASSIKFRYSSKIEVHFLLGLLLLIAAL